jgi:hypothetical protein
MTLTGKGYYIWIVRYAENGDPDRIAALAREANLSHVMIKIADGAFPYNVDLQNGYDYARPAIKKLQAQNIQVFGWQYVYGNYPDQEAEIAVARALELGIDGFVVNAEIEYKSPAKAPAASRYMNILRNNLGSMPIALSSYRYPSYHPTFPWVNFLDRCDYNMPQIYWIKAHNNAGEQLQRSVREFQNLHPYRPIIPTGPTFKQDGWIPTQPEVIEFMQVAKQLNLPAVNFWYWEGCRKYMPAFWDLVRDFEYVQPTQAEESLPETYLKYLNNHDFDQILSFYADNAVLVCPQGAVQGKNAIRGWIESVTKDYSRGDFKMVDHTRHNYGYNFKWQAANDKGNQMEGRDTIGIRDRKIGYHYSFVRQNEPQA